MKILYLFACFLTLFAGLAACEQILSARPDNPIILKDPSTSSVLVSPETIATVTDYQAHMKNAYEAVGLSPELTSRLVGLDTKIYQSRLNGDLRRTRSLIHERNLLMTSMQAARFRAYLHEHPMTVRAGSATFSPWKEADLGGSMALPAQGGIMPSGGVEPRITPAIPRPMTPSWTGNNPD